MADPLPSHGLAAFVAAVEGGSIRAAAEALDLTQSATTKRVQALEARLGVPLLIRDRHGVRPSEQGMTLYPEARRSLDALARAERALVAGTASSPLRLASCHTVGECLLPDWLADFRAVEPEVRPQVEVVTSPVAIEAVSSGAAEVGFVEGLDRLDGLESIEIGRDEIVVVVAAGHRWDGRESVTPADLAGGRYIAREAGSGTRAVADARLAEVGVRLEPVLTVASVEGLKRAVASGGFTLISRLALEPQLGDGPLLALPIAGLPIERPLRAIRRAEGRHREAARHFWRWLPSVLDG